MIGDSLKQRIVELGLTQQRAADQLGISQSRLNQYLKDKREPDGRMLCKICRTFGVSPNRLFGFEDAAIAVETPKINKAALEKAVLFLKEEEEKRRKTFAPEKAARIISVVYDIILSESEENAKKAVDWVIEAIA